MSTVAKVFIVLNLIFAVIYVGVSAALLAKQENWYWKHQNLRVAYDNDVEKFTAQADELQAKLTTAEQANESYRSKVNGLENDLKQSRQERELAVKTNESLQGEIGKLREEYQVILKDLNDQRAENERLTKSFDELRGKYNEAVTQREQSIDDKQRIAKDKEDLQMILDDLEKRHIELAKRNQENENIIQNYLAKLKIRIPGELLKAPAIHGSVVGVSDQFNLVMLNVGENDQVKPGYEFTIYRGKTFVGRVKVDRVFPDMCACIALQEYHKDTIKKGDDASTRVE
jgi:hypothetical protein